MSTLHYNDLTTIVGNHLRTALKKTDIPHTVHPAGDGVWVCFYAAGRNQPSVTFMLRRQLIVDIWIKQVWEVEDLLIAPEPADSAAAVDALTLIQYLYRFGTVQIRERRTQRVAS